MTGGAGGEGLWEQLFASLRERCCLFSQESCKRLLGKCSDF